MPSELMASDSTNVDTSSVVPVAMTPAAKAVAKAAAKAAREVDALDVWAAARAGIAAPGPLPRRRGATATGEPRARPAHRPPRSAYYIKSEKQICNNNNLLHLIFSAAPGKRRKQRIAPQNELDSQTEAWFVPTPVCTHSPPIRVLCGLTVPEAAGRRLAAAPRRLGHRTGRLLGFPTRRA